MQCHRSYIVNVNQIEYLEGNQAVINKEKIPIINGYKEDFLSKFGQV
ncbi:MAG: hypothetical protein HKO66_02485 [Saprospiraceae bacterium]|nr:LytTR family transcriptional regulator DNA-binding domain-containing protein [Bacteroidia bacterium]NNE13371.1 hypothetical protein [Saprospiraceae bacterium]NNL91080.1 hypothetical protein [Saprospiraceae bacterium]